jgi:hypothetical protein
MDSSPLRCPSCCAVGCVCVTLYYVIFLISLTVEKCHGPFAKGGHAGSEYELAKESAQGCSERV